MGSNSLLNWPSIINGFSKEFRIYAVDSIGDIGLSTFTTPINKPDDYAQWLDELFTELELGNNINLLGSSYGAWLTALYAVRFQNRLNKVVLLAPAATVTPVNPQFIARLLLASFPIDYFKKSFSLWLDPVAKESPVEKQIQDIRDRYGKLYKVTFYLNPTLLSDEELKSIKCPVFFLVGEYERVFSPDEAMDRLEKVVPHFKKKIIPGVGHLTLRNYPLTIVTILAFLKENKEGI